MKSYLSLIPISAGVRRKQNRMIFLCIFLAVFLVTSIFSLAEMGLKMELTSAVDKGGNWHIAIKDISEEQAQSIAGRSDVKASSWYDVINFDEHLNIESDYEIEGIPTALCGIEEMFVTEIMHYFSESAQVTEGNQVILTENVKEHLRVEAGDTITLNTPAGDYSFVISGFRISGDGKYVNSSGGVASALPVKENQAGIFMNIRTFREIAAKSGEVGSPKYYICFRKGTNLKKAMRQIKEEYGLGDGQIELNTIVMAAKGISNKSYIQNIYPLVIGLFLLVLAAGVLMISNSINSSVARRMQFFGMLRCIGASKGQIIRYVRLEALNWCKTAVPAGIVLGIAAIWIMGAGLKYGIGGEFTDIPVFFISYTGVLSGGMVGVVTVFLGAQVPAKRAAQASPVTAVSGGSEEFGCKRHGANVRLGRIETALGIHHAISAKKNLFLMTGSFALSIILFFCFSVLIEFVGYLLPQKLYSPDMDIASEDQTNSIRRELADQIREVEGVAHVFGRRVCFDIPAQIPRNTGKELVCEEDSFEEFCFVTKPIDFMSYDDYQLGLLEKDGDLRKGSQVEAVYGDSSQVLAIWDREMPLKIGDVIRINGKNLRIAGMLKYNPFSNDGGTDGTITIIASEETFIRLTGITDYAILDVQVTGPSKEQSSQATEQIRRLSKGYVFRDRRDENVEGTFRAMQVCAYGFLGIIALIGFLNIMNSISMSVSARMNQYGAMRAVGMSGAQIMKMIAVEAFTYVACGCAVGFFIGLPLSKYLFDCLITAYFYYASWQIPLGQILIVLAYLFMAAFVSFYVSSKQIQDMRITDAINEL